MIEDIQSTQSTPVKQKQSEVRGGQKGAVESMRREQMT
jgi:hypothetical protein